MATIAIENVVKEYGAGAGGVKAIDGVSLTIPNGDFFFLLGPSGCGKTTLLRVIAGLVEPTQGRLRFDGHDVSALPAEQRGTAMVFQSYALWPHMTVQANVEFGPRMQGLARSERRTVAEAALATVDMAHLGHRKPRQLSGGQQQRVALARALAARPACLLLDEPLSNLDAQLRMAMRQQLRQLVKSSQTTAVYVTHDQKEALAMADHIAVMRAGRVVQCGTPTEIYNRPCNGFVARFVGDANLVDGEVAGRDGARCRVRTPLGDIEGEAEGSLAVGQRVQCCLRPERLQIGCPGQDGPPAWPATITSRIYQGETLLVHCRLRDGMEWKALVVGAADLPPSDEVVLRWQSKDVIVFPAMPADAE